MIADMSSTAFIEPLPVKDFVAQLLNRDIATSTTRPLSDADRVKVSFVVLFIPNTFFIFGFGIIFFLTLFVYSF